MPCGKISCQMPASAVTVFEVVHDYSRRLEWDTLLKEAKLINGAEAAGIGVCSLCRGRSWLGGFALETEYISFKPAQVAAVKLVNRPLCFDTFAATIRHLPVNESTSELEYNYNFTARPTWLRWVLHPFMSFFFRYETHKRLQALQKFLSEQSR